MGLLEIAESYGFVSVNHNLNKLNQLHAFIEKFKSKRLQMQYASNLHKYKPLTVLHRTGIAKRLDQVPATSLFWDYNSVSRWQRTSITSKNCYCHCSSYGGLQWQWKVHEGIKCNRDFVTNGANQSWFVLALLTRNRKMHQNSWQKTIGLCKYEWTK